MDTLSDDLFNIIFSYLKDSEPKQIYKLRSINKQFKFNVDKLKNNYDIKYVENNIKMQNILNKLFWNEKSIKLFEWFFENNIFLTENNITNLIINNRLDILKECIKYNNLLDIIFKKNYNFLNHFPSSKLVLENSPLILAGQNGNYEIVKFLLNTNLFKNPYLHQIDILIEECIKKRNIQLIKYLVTYFYKYIKNKSETIFNILKKLNNIEDLVFYLIQSNKCIIISNVVLVCIEKNYVETCKYVYQEFYKTGLLNPEIHIQVIIENNNIELLKYFFEYFPEKINLLSNELNNIYYNKFTKKLFTYIYNNYYDKLNSDCLLIYHYLQFYDDLNEIKKMVDEKFIITKETIEYCLKMDKKEILKYLVEFY